MLMCETGLDTVARLQELDATGIFYWFVVFFSDAGYRLVAGMESISCLNNRHMITHLLRYLSFNTDERRLTAFCNLAMMLYVSMCAKYITEMFLFIQTRYYKLYART